MGEHNNLKPKEHLDYLDSARGIAAVMVIVCHYSGWQYGDSTGNKLAGLVFNGVDAVSFFFVLSGFVLSYKYIVLGHALDIRKFLINRVFRLWPAFFVTIIITTLSALYRSGINLTSLTETFIFNKTQFWEEALIFWSVQKYYHPGWTLVIELGASFFLPFVIALAKKDIRYIYWMLLVTLLFGRTVGFGFLLLFIWGVLISCLFFKITDDSFKQTKWYKYRHLILLVALVLFSSRQLDRLSPLGPSFIYVTNYLGIGFYDYSGLASFVFIAAMISSDLLKKILRLKSLLFLGKICYGIYLMHWVLNDNIFFFKAQIMQHFSSTLSAYLIVFVFYSAGTIILATLIHYTIEQPFIRMGKRITDKMKPSLTMT